MRRVWVSLILLLAVLVPFGWHDCKGIGTHQISRLLLREFQPIPSQKVQQVLAQPFFYWGKGSQAHVFVSEDQRFVLKVPRADKGRESLLNRFLGRKERKTSWLRSFRVAFEHLQPETALLYAHYGKIDWQAPESCVLYDAMGRKLPIFLRNIPFLLQERKKLISHALEYAGTREERERILVAFLILLEKEKGKGWISEDRSFWVNVGYEANQAWRIDVGSYIPLEHSFSWEREAKPVLRWLADQDPLLYEWFRQELNERNARW